MYVENRTKIANFPTPVYLTPPLKGFPLEFCIGADMFSGFDTIPECDSHPASHDAVAITLNAKASSLKTSIAIG